MNSSEGSSTKSSPKRQDSDTSLTDASSDISSLFEKLPSSKAIDKSHDKADNQPNRRKKDEDQIRYLQRLFIKTGGVCDRRYRKEAMKATGLTWLQIYKWFFDKQSRINAAKRECTCYTQSTANIFLVTRNGEEVGKMLDVFSVQKQVA